MHWHAIGQIQNCVDEQVILHRQCSTSCNSSYKFLSWLMVGRMAQTVNAHKTNILDKNMTGSPLGTDRIQWRFLIDWRNIHRVSQANFDNSSVSSSNKIDSMSRITGKISRATQTTSHHQRPLERRPVAIPTFWCCKRITQNIRNVSYKPKLCWILAMSTVG